MDVIHLLPDSVANQIAAGEVIQRPASCLKELVENAIDAGAQSIQVLLQDAGSTLLQVIDDGKGMSETDVRMAFERHATSKIREASDLFSLHTMGFRGEALASIAAVARVEVISRREEDELGTCLMIEGSRVLSQEPVAAPVGTSMKVKDLFFNVPARRRFLKKEATELRNLIADFQRIVLVYPHIQFLLVNNDEILLDLPVQSTAQRIEKLFGSSQKKSLAAQLVEVNAKTELVNISGYVGKPEAATKAPQQYMFVNGRYMKHPYFHKAVMNAYQGMLTADHNPSYFIYFDINPNDIDVNIHPTKTEIKFADEPYIWQILSAAVRQSLGKFHVVPSLDFEQPTDVEIPQIPTDLSQVRTPQVPIDKTYNPFNSHSSYRPSFPSTKGWEQLYTKELEKEQPEQVVVEQPITQPALFEDITLVKPYQHKEKYIVLSGVQGLMIIDQHRAHVSIQYHYFCDLMRAHKGVKQQLLFPEIIDLSTDEVSTLLAVQDDLRNAGFELTQISKQSFSIDAIPAELSGQSAMQSLVNILHTIMEENISTQAQRNQAIALALAEDSAIRTGKVLSEMEMKDLAQHLFALTEYTFTPDGKRILTVLENDEIEKRLK